MKNKIKKEDKKIESINKYLLFEYFIKFFI